MIFFKSFEVIDFVESKKIPVIYSNYFFMQKARFLGQNRLDFRSCYNPHRYISKCKWQIFSHGEKPIRNSKTLKIGRENFAFTVSTAKGISEIKEFLVLNKISFQRENTSSTGIFMEMTIK